MTFLVTLTNKMGVPVLFIGTMNASKLFERTARMARRCVGVFGEPWERFKPDSGQWNDFLEDLWQYRWTQDESALDKTLRSVIYDETQGVIDLAVKLFMRVQQRLILRAESSPSFPETIEASFVRQVAKTDFGPIQGFIDALRSGDRDRINAFEDLSTFKRDFDKISDELVGQPKVTISERRRRDSDSEDAGRGDAIDLADQAVRAELRNRGLEREEIDRLIDQAKIDLDDENPSLMALMAQLQKLLTPKGRKRTAAAKPTENLVDGDLRKLARDAADAGRLVREALADAGIGGAASLQFAA